MKKYASLLLLAGILCINGCKKDNNTKPANNNSNNNNSTATSPYYFKFSLNDTSYNLNADFPQYETFYTYLAGGYQVANTSLFPSMGLDFIWKSGDTVQESDVLALAGKTFYFNDTAAIQPNLSFTESLSGATWYSNDTSNTNYNVKVTSVTFLKNDTTLGTPVRTYVITGTCSAVMSQSTTNMALTGGSFNFVISRVNY